MSDFDDALELLGITEDDIYEDVADQIEAGLDERAQRLLNSWEGSSPEDSGDYKEGFEIRSMTGPDGQPIRRVSNQSKHAHIVEYGSEDQQGQYVRAKVAKRNGNEGPYTEPGAQ